MWLKAPQKASSVKSRAQSCGIIITCRKLRRDDELQILQHVTGFILTCCPEHCRVNHCFWTRWFWWGCSGWSWSRVTWAHSLVLQEQLLPGFCCCGNQLCRRRRGDRCSLG